MSPTLYLWTKTLHIVMVTSWFAGLFYLPRIYVNLAQVSPATSRAEYDRLVGMSRRLYRFMLPLATLATATGLLLFLGFGIGMGSGWDARQALLRGAAHRLPPRLWPPAAEIRRRALHPLRTVVSRLQRSPRHPAAHRRGHGGHETLLRSVSPGVLAPIVPQCLLGRAGCRRRQAPTNPPWTGHHSHNPFPLPCSHDRPQPIVPMINLRPVKRTTDTTPAKADTPRQAKPVP